VEAAERRRSHAGLQLTCARVQVVARALHWFVHTHRVQYAYLPQ